MWTQCVLALLVLYVGLAHCFSWDIVLGGPNGLNFYNNGTQTHTVSLPSVDVASIIYDPVYNRVLFFDSKTSLISGYDIATMKMQTILRCKQIFFGKKFAYDPATETIFRVGNEGIYSFSLQPESNNTVDGNLLVQIDGWFGGIAVDSCGGYVYWTTNYNIERVRFNGSGREVLVDNAIFWRPDLAVDQQTQRMFWIEKYSEDRRYPHSIESADLNGKNRRTLYTEKNPCYGGSITVSKDSVYWRGREVDNFWQLAKDPSKQFSTTHTDFCDECDAIAANYQVEDQTHELGTCDALTRLLPSISSNFTTDIITQTGLICVHGEKVIGESVCKCEQGYTGERCDVFVCQNYCFQGDCSVSAEGQPKCRCNAGYSGERCEVDACHKHCLNNGVCSLNNESVPVCQCTVDYKAERCDIPVCQDYCIQGNCSVSADGHPQCRCDVGYSGQRCEVNVCLGYCSNNGVCYLNEESKPVCQCTGDYDGERCEESLSAFFTKCFRIAPTLSSWRDILDTDVPPVTVDKEVLQLLSETSGACSRNEL